MMTKSAFVGAVAAKTGLSKKDAAAAVNAYADVLKEALASGEAVQLSGFGTFQVSERPARMGKNPRTGEPVQVAASNVVRFKAGSALKAAVNQ